MTEIHITHEAGDEYRVEVTDSGGSTRHRVTVPPDDLERYGGGASAEALLEASFRFLLEREPREAILSSFEVSVIERYFLDYPREIRRRLDRE